MFNHILVPLDASDCSHKALELGITLAREQKAQCTLVSVIDIAQEAGPLVPFTSGNVADHWLKTLTDEANATVSDALKRYADSGVSLDGAVIEGYPADSIVEVAKQRGADLIVMGTHGRSGFRHLLLGSVAESVLRASTVPVLTVRET